jgi:hypothetical protein
MFRPDQPFVTIITALTRAWLSLCALGLWRRLSLLGGDEAPAVMRFFGFICSCVERRHLAFDGVFTWITRDGTHTIVCELLSRYKGK